MLAAVGQVPVPEQLTAWMNNEPEQEDEPQPTLLEACSQWLAPSHRPSLPQDPLAAHCPVGSGEPAGIDAQIPVSLTLQAWQVPQPLVEQQTPSMQLPLPHSCPVPQVAPSPFFGRQVPLVVDVQ